MIEPSSHHLIFPSKCYVRRIIQEVEEELGLEAPRGLWHAYFFYFSGVVTNDLLKEEGLDDYELYIVRKRSFHWVFPMLDQNLPDYLNGTSSLKECTKNIHSVEQARKKMTFCFGTVQ